jgi:hypothetical protein
MIGWCSFNFCFNLAWSCCLGMLGNNLDMKNKLQTLIPTFSLGREFFWLDLIQEINLSLAMMPHIHCNFYPNIFLKFFNCRAFDKDVKVDIRFYLHGCLILHMDNQSIYGPIGATCWRTTICNRYNDNHPFSCCMIHPLFYNNWPPH